MERSEVFYTDAQALAKMLDTNDAGLWESEDLGAMLEHQLDAPLEDELGVLDPGLAARLSASAAHGDKPLRSFRDLFCHPHPSVELLELAKRFAKRCRNQADSPLPDELSTLLYLLAITIAWTKCGRHISRLDHQALQYGLDWALDRPWLDRTTRALLAEGWKTIKAEVSQSS